MLLNRVPFPLNDGGAIAMYAAIRGYVENDCHVHVLAMNTSKHFVEQEKVAEVFDFVQQMDTVNVDNRISFWGAVLNLFSAHSYILQRFVSAEFEARLTDILTRERFDIVHLDTLTCMLYADVVRKHSNAKLVYRAHNVEQQIWERTARNEKNVLKKWYLRWQTARLKKFETSALLQADVILSISTEDETAFRKITAAPVVYLPAGMQVADEASVSSGRYDLFFIGSFDWLPNLQGIDWFFENVWSSVFSRFPGLSFYIAGKKMPPHVFNRKTERIIPVGEVPDSKEFILQHGIMLVPLVSGSGIRIKIVEAMALGKCIIATTIAAEGLGLTNGENILIANTAEEFVEQIEKCSDAAFRNKIGLNAHRFALENFQNKRIFEKLLTTLRKTS